MATLIDERPEKEEEKTEEQISQLTAEPELQETPQEDAIPDKYKGKSTADIVRMHQEAEKLLGRQSSEVGELRSVVDNYIQTQLDTTSQASPEPEEDVDFFTDPDKAVEKHPDIQAILADSKFVDWIKASKIRTQLFAQADAQYDYEAADELFSNWKERKQVVTQSVANEKASRKTAVKAASTGNATGSGETASRKIYRRSDIIRLMKDDPDRYLSLSDEITQAYQEGRVRN